MNIEEFAWQLACTLVGVTEAQKLKERTFHFSVAVFRAVRSLARNSEARVPMGQVIRSSASVGANYRAVCRAKSKRDFIAKLGTVIEEGDESMFWLEYLQATELLANATVLKLRGEANELVSILRPRRRPPVRTMRGSELRDGSRRRELPIEEC